jgi:hypothetical protein
MLWSGGDVRQVLRLRLQRHSWHATYWSASLHQPPAARVGQVES